MKIIKFFPVIFAFFVFDCSASFFDRESSLSEQQIDNVEWAYASNIWFMKVNPESIYRVNSLAKLDVVELSRETTNVLPEEVISRRSTISFFVSLVVQMSIDMFVQSNIGMNSYKNLLMGMDTMLSANNDLLSETESLNNIDVLEKQIAPDISVKAVEKIDVSEVPVPNGIWLFMTAFLGGVGLGKRFKLAR